LLTAFHFPKRVVPVTWLRELRDVTDIFRIYAELRPDLSEKDRISLIQFWDRLFQKEGELRISLDNEGAFFATYHLSRKSAKLENNTLLVTYAIKGQPTFRLQDF